MFNNGNQIGAQFGSFMRNPMQFLLQRKINLPQEYANDPQGAVQYLMSTGQMSQTTFENLRSQATQMGVNLK
ncbi:MAG: hypothetical protein J6Y02_07355 [Pseudobutyrivibrio sp.]|nr:hypothetical protein [Pseudobutyrivibrio sp.]